MNANLLVRINAVLNRISRSYSQLPVILFFFFLIIGSHAFADDQISITITDPAPVCFPQTVDLTSPAIVAGSTPGLVFTYYTDMAMTIVVANPTSVGAGTYYILGKRTPPSFGSASASIIVTVDPISVGGTIASDQTLCFGNSASDLVLIGYTGNIIKWQKSSNIGFTSPTDINETSSTLSSATIGVLNTSTYFRALVKSGICSSANSAPVLVTVTPLVGIPATPSPSATTICQGSANTTYTVSATDAISYDWTVTGAGNTISGTGSTATVTWAAGFSGSATVGVTANGCNSSKASSSATVTVTPAIGPPVFTFGATSTRCQGAGSVTYTATSVNSTGISYSLDAVSLSGGNSIDVSTGAVTYVAGWSGTSIITASAAGCNGPKTALHTVTTALTVGTPVTPTPTATTICQGSANTAYTTSATNAISYNWSVTGAGNTISGTGTTGTVTWAAGFSGQSTISVTANGCNGPSASASTNVTVTPTVDTPVFALGANSTRCLGAGSVTYTATSANSTVVIYSLDAASLIGGNSIVVSTGAVTYAAGWSGTSIITASAAGCNGPKISIHTVTTALTVGTPVTPTPTATTICQGSANTIYTTSATNATSYNWSVTGAGNTISGTGTTGTVTWAAGFSGTATISVTADGCNGPSASASTTITLTPAPSATIGYVAPLCSDDMISHPVFLAGSGGGIFNAPTGLSIDPSSGAIVPGLSTPGIYAVSYTIAPSGGCSAYVASTQIQIGSIPILEDIVIKNVTCTGSNDGSLDANVLGTGSFTYEWTGPSSYSNTGASIRGLSPGVYSLKVTNANGCSKSTSATILESPIPLSITVAGTNATKAGATDGTIDATTVGGTLPYDYKWTGPISFIANTEDLTGLKFGSYLVNVTDNNGCSKSSSFVVKDPPLAVDDDSVCIEDKLVTINVVANDVDADGTIAVATVDLNPLVAGIQTSYEVANKGSFSVSAEGVVTFTSLSHYLGLVVIQYVVSDNSGLLSNVANISVNVVVNRPPVAIDDNISVAEDNPINGNLFVNDYDPEGKPLTLESFTIGSTVYSPQTNVSIDGVGTLLINQNGTFTFVPHENYYGIVPQVSYKIVDVEGLSASANLNITVTPVNDPPVAIADNFETKENNKLEANILSNDFDIEGDAITLDVIPVQRPTHGELVITSTGDITYQPVIDFIGTDSFTYQICDNGDPSLCSVATVTILVSKDANCDVFVPNVFTPNADGVHDYFKIRCLYNYENPQIQIYNRGGILIFKKDHYGNLDFWGSEDQAFWNGRSDNKWNLMNDELPVGTYYYVLKLGEGKVLTGFVFLGK